MKIASFTPAEIVILRAAYGKLRTVTMDTLPKLRALFADCSDAALDQLAKGRIKFVSKLAVNAQARRRGQFSLNPQPGQPIKSYPMTSAGTAAYRRDQKVRSLQVAVFGRGEAAF